jgi:phosphoribosylformylglycinamidine synthase
LPTSKPVPKKFQNPGRTVLLLGGLGVTDETTFGGTQYAKTIIGTLWGMPPKLDMQYEKRVHDAMRAVVSAELAESSHDLSTGGLACALAACGGAEIAVTADGRPEHILFGEAPSRILVSTTYPEKVQAIAREHNVECVRLGTTTGGALRIRVGDRVAIETSASEIEKRTEEAFPALLHVHAPA